MWSPRTRRSIDRLEAELLVEAGQGGLPVSGTWTPVLPAQSPFTASSFRKFLVDARTGPVQIDFTLSKLVNNDVIVVSDEYVQGSQNPITFKPPTGITMEDPSQPGTYRAGTGQLAAMTGGSGCVWWQYIQSAGKLVAIVGV